MAKSGSPRKSWKSGSPSLPMIRMVVVILLSVFFEPWLVSSQSIQAQNRSMTFAMQGATFTMASDCGSTPTPGSSVPIFATQVDQAATAATVASFQPQINHLFDLQNQVTDFCLFSYYISFLGICYLPVYSWLIYCYLCRSFPFHGTGSDNQLKKRWKKENNESAPLPLWHPVPWKGNERHE